mmetsp:Transcript_24540/g.58189  ORF Transcript_24540/g.58189 Transcript_24540/m.58189 type:complete len:726 (-) Transcript_24540:613-2790(-)
MLWVAPNAHLLLVAPGSCGRGGACLQLDEAGHSLHIHFIPQAVLASASAGLAAASPFSPVRQLAVHAEVGATLLIREVPAGRAPEVVGDLHGAAPVLGADAVGMARGPARPVRKLAVHGATHLVALLGLLLRSFAVRGHAHLGPCHRAGPALLATLAARGAHAPLRPVGPEAVEAGVVAALRLVQRRTGHATKGGLHFDRPVSRLLALAEGLAHGPSAPVAHHAVHWALLLVALLRLRDVAVAGPALADLLLGVGAGSLLLLQRATLAHCDHAVAALVVERQALGVLAAERLPRSGRQTGGGRQHAHGGAPEAQLLLIAQRRHLQQARAAGVRALHVHFRASAVADAPGAALGAAGPSRPIADLAVHAEVPAGLVLREVPTDLAAVQGRLRHHAAALLGAGAEGLAGGPRRPVAHGTVHRATALVAALLLLRRPRAVLAFALLRHRHAAVVLLLAASAGDRTGLPLAPVAPDAVHAHVAAVLRLLERLIHACLPSAHRGLHHRTAPRLSASAVWRAGRPSAPVAVDAVHGTHLCVALLGLRGLTGALRTIAADVLLGVGAGVFLWLQNEGLAADEDLSLVAAGVVNAVAVVGVLSRAGTNRHDLRPGFGIDSLSGALLPHGDLEARLLLGQLQQPRLRRGTACRGFGFVRQEGTAPGPVEFATSAGGGAGSPVTPILPLAVQAVVGASLEVLQVTAIFATVLSFGLHGSLASPIACAKGHAMAPV